MVRAGPPAATVRYRPSDPLDRFVRARDRRCRFPGCRARPIRCDLDHVVPWPAGPTSASNLCCLCRHHHRLSHQAPGWTMRRLADGGLEWTLPGGDRLVTHPIPVRHRRPAASSSSHRRRPAAVLTRRPHGTMDRVSPLSGEALRLRCIEAVVDEGERFGMLAQERRPRGPRCRGCRSGGPATWSVTSARCTGGRRPSSRRAPRSRRRAARSRSRRPTACSTGTPPA